MAATLALNLNIGFLSVSAVAALLISMGFVVFLSDMESVTHKAFLALTGTSVIWSLFNYAVYQSDDPDVVLWFLRFIMFSATWFAYSFFTFFYVFPEREHLFPTWYRFFLLPFTAAISIATLTPAVFEAVQGFSAAGQVQQVVNGQGIFFFGALVFLLDFGGLYFLIKKTLKARGTAENPYRTILVGAVTTILLIIVFSFLLPAFFDISALVPYGTLFLLPFIGFTAYAIHYGKVMNVKEITTALLVSALATATLIEVIFTTDPILILFRTSLFGLILVVGLLLVRGVVREVQQREKIEVLAKELAETNERQTVLMHFVTHEVKGYLAKDEGAFSALLEGDFGQLTPELRPFVTRALEQTRMGVASVLSILKASNQKKGTTEYKKESFDIEMLARDLVERSKERAAAKGVQITFTADPTGAPYTLVGDKGEVGDHVLLNLIDNAINYTPSGAVAVSLKKQNGQIVFAVKDTGVGITDEDMKRLFTEGGHGKNSQSINVHSTGYGLFIAKNIVQAHNGTIRAESEGPGKGSTFIAELPAA